jgi:hypothetical protein
MIYAAIVEGCTIEEKTLADGSKDFLPINEGWTGYKHVTPLLEWLRDVARGWSVTLLVRIAVASIRSTWRATRAHVRQLSNVGEDTAACKLTLAQCARAAHTSRLQSPTVIVQP